MHTLQQHSAVALSFRCLDLTLFLHTFERDFAGAIRHDALTLGLHMLLGKHQIRTRKFGIGLRLCFVGLLLCKAYGAVDFI